MTDSDKLHYEHQAPSCIMPFSSTHAVFDYEGVDTTIYSYAGGIFFPPSLTLNAYQDGEAEQLEGFILYLEIVESELDPRDVGNASLSRPAYLVRINQSGTVMKLVTGISPHYFTFYDMILKFMPD